MNDSLLIEDISYLVLADSDQSVLENAWVWIENGFIKDRGSGEIPEEAGGGPRLSGQGKIATPGLVNTHHHFYQNMARAYTPGNNLPLLPWLERMNKLWKHFREDDLQVCTQLGIAELMLSGATTIADHHYVFTEGSSEMTLHQFKAASEMGVRLHASRGSMNPGAIGKSSLPPVPPLHVPSRSLKLVPLWLRNSGSVCTRIVVKR